MLGNKNTSWDGPRKGYTFEKFKRKWYNAIAILERHKKAVPCPADMVSDFILAVTDPRLKPAGILIMDENSAYRNDFEKTAAYFTRLLAMESARDSRQSEAKRKLSALGGGGREGGRGRGRFGGRGGGRGRGRGGGYQGSQVSGKGYKGEITSGSYGPEDWATMTYGQRQKVLKLRYQEASTTDKDKEKTRIAAAASKKNGDKADKEKKGGKGGKSGNQFGEGAHE